MYDFMHIIRIGSFHVSSVHYSFIAHGLLTILMQSAMLNMLAFVLSYSHHNCHTATVTLTSIIPRPGSFHENRFRFLPLPVATVVIVTGVSALTPRIILYTASKAFSKPSDTRRRSKRSDTGCIAASAMPEGTT